MDRKVRGKVGSWDGCGAQQKRSEGRTFGRAWLVFIKHLQQKKRIILE